MALNPDGTILWERFGYHITSKPVLRPDGSIYCINSDNDVCAFNSTGEVLWRYPTPGRAFLADAVGPGGVLCCTSDTGKLLVLSMGGNLLWERQFAGEIWNAPLISPDGTIYVSVFDGPLYALNADGTERWTVDTGSNTHNFVMALGAGGELYATYQRDGLIALTADGTERWVIDDIGLLGGITPSTGPDGIIYLTTWAEGGYPDLLQARNPDGSVRWMSLIDGPLTAPVIGDDGTIYITEYVMPNLYTGVSAYSPDGVRKWHKGELISQDNHVLYGRDDIIYYTSGDEFAALYAFNSDSSQRWVFEPGGDLLMPVISPDGMVYVGNRFAIGVETPSDFYAVNRDGVRQWTYQSTVGQVLSPAVDTAGVYIGYSGIMALKLDGSPLWNYDVESRFTAPVIGANGAIYFCNRYDMVCLDAGGAHLWTTNLPGIYEALTPAIGPDGMIYAVNGRVAAISKDGVPVWSVELPGSSSTAPVVGVDGTIYVSRNKRVPEPPEVHGLFALTPDGEVKWRFESESGFYCAPALAADGTVYVNGWSEGSLYAIDRLGYLRWRLTAGIELNSFMTLGDDGMIYFSGLDGSLYAVRNDGSLQWSSAYGGGAMVLGADGTLYSCRKGVMFAFHD